VTYVPQYLDAEVYQQIISTPRERGPVDANGTAVGGQGGCCGGDGQSGTGTGTCDGTGSGSGQGGNGSGSGNGQGRP
jgi:hypothetical protein